MDDRALTLLLRLIHILAGVFWAGSVFFLAGFLIPTVRETGPEGGRVMSHLVGRRRLPVFIGIAILLTVVSGLITNCGMLRQGGWSKNTARKRMMRASPRVSERFRSGWRS